MFDRKMFAGMRRAGMGIGVSKAKIAEAMLEILVQLPRGSTDMKERVIRHLGILGQMAATRDLEQAWNQAKKKAARLHPDRFTLGPRNVLCWRDDTKKTLDKDISPANFKRLNELADAAGCTVNAIVVQLMKAYKQRDGRSRSGP